MAGLFNRDPVVISTVVSYLRIIAVTYGFQGILLLSASVLNAAGKPIHAIILSLFRLLGLYIPLALLWSKMFGLRGIFAGGAVANLVSGIIAALVVIKIIGKSLSSSDKFQGKI